METLRVINHFLNLNIDLPVVQRPLDLLMIEDLLDVLKLFDLHAIYIIFSSLRSYSFLIRVWFFYD